MKKSLQTASRNVALATALLVAANASAATYYWDTNGATPGSGAATGTWDSGISALWTTDATGSIATSAITTAIDSDLIFSAGSNGTAGTITVSGAQLANSLTFAQPGLVFNSGDITLTNNNPLAPSVVVNEDTTINATGNLSQFSAISVAAGKTLTLSSTNTAGNANNFFLSESNVATGGIVGGGTVKLTAGNFTTQSNPFIKNGSTTAGGLLLTGTSTMTVGGGLQVGRDGTAGRLEINSATAAINITGQMTVGRGTSGNYVQSAGTFNSTHVSATDSSVMIGRDGGGNQNGVVTISGGTFNVIGNGIAGNSGGVLTLNAGGNNAGSSGTLNISGGVVTVKDLRFNGNNSVATGTATAGSSIVNLSGGSLYVGGTIINDGSGGTNGGIRDLNTGTATSALNLTGGTLGANANWTSSMAMTVGTSGGGVTIKAADVTDIAHDITLSGVISGAGGIVKSGGGNLTLSGVNTYTGVTQVNAGTLTLGSFNSITALGTLAFTDGASISLGFASGSETVNFLYDSTQNKFMTPGTWTASQLNQFFGTSTFSSMGGTLTVTAVPEPSTWALLTISLTIAGFAVRQRARRLA
ncbi:MAG TPA: autotransporter-associated beta strand repeat-containing protein [Chthoniobacterales bacterium]|nr:autotransporter-associated beta strand repeat-containing protein [Chthoniobacterales bacterium]